MANQLITTDLVANTALASFSVNAPFVMTASRLYEKDFTQSGYKVGDTIRLRRQNIYNVGDGPVAVPQDIVEATEEIKIEHQYNAYITYTVEDLVLRIDEFNERFIQPAVQSIITKMETDIGSAAELQLNYFNGTPGVPINSFSSVDTAGAKLLEMGVDLSNPAYMAMTVRDGSSLKSALLNQFTPAYNERIVRRSRIADGHLSYFDVFQSQNIKRHIAGAGPTLHPADPLVVNGTVSSGNTIVLAGASASIANYFVPGDAISISGVQNVNPLSGLGTGQDMQFVITAAASSTAGGAVTIQVAPEILVRSANPQGQLSNAILTGSTVTMYPSGNVNVAYINRGLDIVCPPLYRLETPKFSISTDPTTGLSLAVVQSGDPDTYQNKMRIDLLCGFKWHPQYAVKQFS